MQTILVLATRNAHKAAEIRAILSDRFGYLTLKDFPAAPAVLEDATTFAGNATKKAVELARWLSDPRLSKLKGETRQHLLVLADDSGLEVDALGGAPGVHSARFAAADPHGEGNTPDADNNAKLLRLLAEVPLEKRSARFRCVLALTPVRAAQPAPESASPVCSVDGFEVQTELFEGACEGRIGFEPGGKGGFGYDPLFIPAGETKTFAELGEEEKNRMSHRSRALERLRAQLERGRLPR